MDNSVLNSTLFLTLLMVVGMLFFIRAAAKDRTQIVTLGSEQDGDQLLAALKQYFVDRSYQVDAIDAVRNQVLLSGQVRASVFLAVFLSLMAGVGALCLGLILTVSLPDVPYLWAVFLGFAPLAGWLYWRKASRVEQVSFRLDETQQPTVGSWLRVKAHRDEVEALQEALNLQVVDNDVIAD
ncbi:cofactor assembly of complex C subunit B [filamentous cyanobacterium LEGE 11480]|uniref:Cofactor assembly of complex C subunit B n=1 Tax=Romeriopsis navalis LEGE 11480 TaxID=2777977 RepID=A0A928VQT0_9CYAN|nr:cofactor assembly of complex C subunit B [Romeriopsis navalis]MBE9030832.1 cofactor assembly of complex C subunit B [Romeriopsis navalis LEGE 11480]